MSQILVGPRTDRFMVRPLIFAYWFDVYARIWMHSDIEKSGYCKWTDMTKHKPVFPFQTADS